MKKLFFVFAICLSVSACNQNISICYDKHVDNMTEREFEFCRSWASKDEIYVSNKKY